MLHITEVHNLQGIMKIACKLTYRASLLTNKRKKQTDKRWQLHKLLGGSNENNDGIGVHGLAYRYMYCT